MQKIDPDFRKALDVAFDMAVSHLEGRRAMRISVCNWQTSDKDVERVVQAVAGVLK